MSPNHHFSYSDEFNEYKRKTKILHLIQHPCLWLASFCLSFLVFSSVIYRVKLSTFVFVAILAIGLICLITGFVAGRIEKKLFRQELAKLNIQTQKAIKESSEQNNEKKF